MNIAEIRNTAYLTLNNNQSVQLTWFVLFNYMHCRNFVHSGEDKYKTGLKTNVCYLRHFLLKCLYKSGNGAVMYLCVRIIDFTSSMIFRLDFRN
jgi:hypothetical protein